MLLSKSSAIGIAITANNTVKHLSMSAVGLPRGNHDLFVLRAENQNQTTVTPRIASLCDGLVRETLKILESEQSGKKRKNSDNGTKKVKRERESGRLRDLMSTSTRKKLVVIPREFKINATFAKAAVIDSKIYNVICYPYHHT
jgi:hypothetical protein